MNIGLQDSFFHDNKKNHAHDEGLGIALTNPIPEVYEIKSIIYRVTQRKRNDSFVEDRFFFDMPCKKRYRKD